MATIIPFLPNDASSPPFQAQVTLDGNPYQLVTMWNFYRGYWYVSITDQNGTVVCNQPLIGSPPDFDIPLFPGLFTSSMILYRPSTSNFEQTP
jgi:hypothetical protein